MTVRKFCFCGVKLERNIADEAAAREVVARFRAEHSGYGHGPASREQYLQVISRIVARNAKSNRKPELRPLLSAITRAEATNGHDWDSKAGMVFCLRCKVIKREGDQVSCVGVVALMKPSEFIGYPLPWLRRGVV
jgi:hypothetical protein